MLLNSQNIIILIHFVLCKLAQLASIQYLMPNRKELLSYCCMFKSHFEMFQMVLRAILSTIHTNFPALLLPARVRRLQGDTLGHVRTYKMGNIVCDPFESKLLRPFCLWANFRICWSASPHVYLILVALYFDIILHKDLSSFNRTYARTHTHQPHNFRSHIIYAKHRIKAL